MTEKLILLVVDNSGDELITLDALAEGKLINQTIVVRDSQEALNYLFYEGAFSNRPIGNPQVVLLDLKINKLNELEVLTKIRAAESTKYISVIILTSSQQEKEVTVGHSDISNGYIVKPLDMKKFSSAIQQILFYWIRLNKVLE